MRTSPMGNVPRTGLPRKHLAWTGLVASLLFFAIPPIASDGMGQNTYPHLPPELNRIPDSNQANDINDQQKKKDNFEAANAERKKEIASDTTKLLKLATELKAEVDKYAKEQPVTQDKAKAFEAEVVEHSEIAERHFGRHHTLTIAEGIVHVAVAGASIALLARKRAFWLVSLGLTAVGMAVAAVAYAM